MSVRVVVVGATDPVSGGGSGGQGAFGAQLQDSVEEACLPGALRDLPAVSRSASVLAASAGASLTAAVAGQAAGAASATHIVLVLRAPKPAAGAGGGSTPASLADVAAAAAESEADLSAALALLLAAGVGGGARPLLLVIPRTDDGLATPAALAARTALALAADAAYRAAARGGLAIVDLRVLLDAPGDWVAGALQPAGGAKLASKVAAFVISRMEEEAAAATAPISFVLPALSRPIATGSVHVPPPAAPASAMAPAATAPMPTSVV